MQPTRDNQGEWLAPLGTTKDEAAAWLEGAPSGTFTIVASEGDTEHPFTVVVANNYQPEPVQRVPVKCKGGQYRLVVENGVKKLDNLAALVAYHGANPAMTATLVLVLRAGVAAEPTPGQRDVWAAARAANAARDATWVAEFEQLAAAAEATADPAAAAAAKEAARDFASDRDDDFRRGRDGATKDEALAGAWLVRAADLGHKVCAFNAGVGHAHMSTRDCGWKEDWQKAVKYLTIAAQLGAADAMAALADIYRNGSPESTEFVAKDLAAADAWVLRAKATGGIHSSNAGILEDQERGVHADVAKLDAEEAASMEGKRKRVQAAIAEVNASN